MLKSSLLLAVCVFLSLNTVAVKGCLVAQKPFEMLQCISINPQTLVNLLSNGDLKSFCTTANSYITCLKTYVEDCVGGKVAVGALDELTDLNKKCCMSTDTSKCVTKSNNRELVGNCFAADNFVTLDNNMKKAIIDIQVGDIVKSVDSNGNIVDSEVVAIMHKDSDEMTSFLKFKTAHGDSISLTPGHLLSVKNKGYIKANSVQVGDVMSVRSSGEGFVDAEIVEIEEEMKKGFIAPLTATGTILVSNVHAPCYAEVNSQWIADLAMKPIKLWYQASKYLGMQAPANGLHVYTSVLQQFTMKVLPSLFA